MRAACVLVLLCGCLDSLPPESHDPPDEMPAARGACTDLEGKQFKATSQGECGLGPNGPEYCYWQLGFTASDGTRSEFSWRHSDVGESGTVTCADGVITGMYSGSYDPATLDVMWDGLAYAPAP